MTEVAPRKITLGEYLLDPSARELRRGGEPVPLAPLPFRVLVYLVEHRDRVVTRAELIERFWDGKDVYDDTLNKAVGAIRKSLGDSAPSPRFVVTYYREGYRYVGPFEEVSEPEESATLEMETTRVVGIVVEHEKEGKPHSGTGLAVGALRRPAP